MSWIGRRAGTTSDARAWASEVRDQAPDARDRAPTRRRILAGTGTVGLSALAGCTGIVDFLRGEQPAEFIAEVARVADETLAETGYDLHEIEDVTEHREYEVAGQTREVVITHQQAEYDRAVEVLGDRFQGAVFTALSTPQVNVLGQTFNPVAEMEAADLAELIQDRYDDFDSLEVRDEYTTEILGQDTSVVEYDAEARLGDLGLTIQVVLHIADPVEAGEDFVICLGGYPNMIDDSDAIQAMFGGVQHPGV